MTKFAVLGLLLVACGGAAQTAKTPMPPAPDDGTLKITAKEQFDRALAAFVRHDDANDWSTQACAEVAGLFDDAATRQKGPFVQATFDAGLAWQRCKDDDKARAHFEQAAKDDPKFDPAQARLALYRFRQQGGADEAIDALQKAVVAGEFKNPAALVDLAAMQMSRDGDRAGAGCKDDLDCAKLNLQRALALDDAYMPAMNQLALYYLQLANKRAGHLAPKKTRVASAGSSKKGDVQQLELAALVCAQAIAKNPNYAPIHNTTGLVQHALGRESAAADEFGVATKLDPKFYEAHMNQAALNLSFRGFEKAEAAYRNALVLRPDDYDAHLGLALALRGPITGSAPDYDKRIAAVQSELTAAKKVDPERPDAYFNEGILTQEFLTLGGTSAAKVTEASDRAEHSFRDFLKKAEGKPEYADAVSNAKERLKDIETARQFTSKT